MEGTTIGRPERSVKTENDLEEEFVELMRLAGVSRRIPQFDSDDIRIAPWDYHQDRLQRAGMADFLEHTASRWTTWHEMNAAPSNVVLLGRSNRYTPWWFETRYGSDIRHMTFVWSMWDGYWKDDEHIRPLCERYGVQPVHLHTSGHCTWSDIERFVAGLHPGRIIPIHTEHAEHFARYLHGVTLLQDGEALNL